MVNAMVGRATSSMLIGPDWAMNLEICDVCNRDPVQAKDVVKGIKKRLGSRNPKVKLLALTLLETIVKNCGDIVHSNVADRNLLQDMVKIVKKKPDFHVKEKILILIDTWQEAFGGERGRYPQYYAAYLELLRLGASFPERSARSAPVLTPPQTQPITSIPHNLHNPQHENETGVHTAEADFPTLSLTELQNARGIMDVLAEMLTAIDPQKKEGLKQEVIVDLVEQCRTNKRRLVHLVNSTSDESLLSLGLALNDDLQRVLAKHEALLTGTHVVSSQNSKPETSNPETSRALVPVNTKQPGSASGAGAEPDLISLAPATTNGQSTSPAKVNFDLLSGDDFDLSTDSNPLAIVPVGVTQPATPVSQQNALALVSLFPPQTQQPQYMSAQQQSFYPNGNVVQNQSWTPYNQGNNPGWNGNMAQQQQQQQQQPPLQGFGAGMGSGLPPPPWEAPPAGNQFIGGNGMQYSQPLGSQTPRISNQYAGSGGMQYSQPHGLQTLGNGNQFVGGGGSSMQYLQPQGLQTAGNSNMNNNHILPMNNQPVYNTQQMAYMYPQQMGQQMYGNQMGQQMYGNQMGQAYNSGGYGYGYGYVQQQNAQNAQVIRKSVPGMSGRDDSFLTSTVYTGPSMANASYVHVPSGKSQKPEDALFGDLMKFSKVKPKKV
ncbi:hypothetical protein SSX86_012513 [Deinandra increscens subsp. villosa]|uniref:Uncharacterized protein n=1 Tax=Deinandra increscens subsp. villosa TaxID=3103831 RepID=A0AAP0H3C9_9ASTR